MIKKCLVFLGLLLFAHLSFASDTPKAVATAWAQAVKDRNGKAQYMLMCSELQKANFSNFKALNWVTGVSSPWISSYKIRAQSASKFSIQYQFSLSTGIVGMVTDYIHIIRIDSKVNSSQRFCVSKFKYLSPVDHL